jgi:hypothetical protein
MRLEGQLSMGGFIGTGTSCLPFILLTSTGGSGLAFIIWLLAGVLALRRIVLYLLGTFVSSGYRFFCFTSIIRIFRDINLKITSISFGIQRHDHLKSIYLCQQSHTC